MYVCRLFHRDALADPIEVRLLADGKLTLGRDPSADWPLVDPDGLLSRLHCTLSIGGDGVLLSDSSTNGTFLASGERVPSGSCVPLPPDSWVRLGGLTLHVDAAEPGVAAAHLPLSATPTVLPTGWAEPVPVPTRHRDASLLEAFCAGAHLDASALSGEDPSEVMRRAGAIYQQLVLGLTALLADRTRMKREHSLDRTTVGALDNNPFKWAAPRRLAEELLAPREEGFLMDAEAVRASFADLADHLAASAAGANAAVAAVLADLDPVDIDAEAARQGFSLKGRGAIAREIHGRRHAALAGRTADSPVARAFRDAYLASGSDG